MNIILASSSPSRKLLLEKTGLQFSTVSPNINEKLIEESGYPPEETCLRLAKAKADTIKTLHPESLIIACDQLVFLDGKFYGKAHNIQKAKDTLKSLQGKTHRLINGLYMSYEKKEFSYISTNHMTMRPLTDKQIEVYVNRDKPLKSAGSYLIDQGGIGLFSQIVSEDFSSIIGLPVTQVINQLISWGGIYLTDE